MNKIQTIQSRLDKNNIDKLEKIAEYKGLKTSLLIRLAVLDYIEKNEKILERNNNG